MLIGCLSLTTSENPVHKREPTTFTQAYLCLRKHCWESQRSQQHLGLAHSEFGYLVEILMHSLNIYGTFFISCCTLLHIQLILVCQQQPCVSSSLCVQPSPIILFFDSVPMVMSTSSAQTIVGCFASFYLFIWGKVSAAEWRKYDETSQFKMTNSGKQQEEKIRYIKGPVCDIGKF